MPGDARDHFLRQDRQGRCRHLGHVVQVIVGGLELPGIDVAQEGGHAPLGLAGEQRDAEIERLFQVRRQLGQHREAAARMEPADHHRDAGGAELAADVERARELVRLHADQADEARLAAHVTDQALDVHDGVALVERLDRDVDVRAEHLVGGTIGKQPINAGEAVRRDGRAHPLDDVAVHVVMRRLDQNDFECSRHVPSKVPYIGI